jgi:intein-encoded DNA endonuclease-like protein
MPKLELSNEELNNIITDYNNGMSVNELIKKYHHDRNTLKRFLQENGVKLRDRTEALRCSPSKKEADKAKRKYIVHDEYFSNQNSRMAYLLGFLMADGNVSSTSNKVQICLSEQDAEFLTIFYNEIGGSPVAHYTQNNGKQKICRWQCLSSQIKKDLISYDVIPRKTGFAKIPGKLNKEFYPDFIRGYFDGDGCIWIEKNGAVGFSLTSHNKEILEQVIDYFEENDITRVSIKTDNRCNTNYSFKYRKKASEKIYKLLYYNDDCLYMKRKFDKFTEILKR